MKFTTTKTVLLSLFIATAIISCSSDDDGATEDCESTLWYQDLDSDGLGNPDVSISSCDQPDGYVSNNNDTDDSNSELAIYLPFTIGNTWTYDVSTDNGTPPPTTSTDIITVDGNVTINTKEYADLSMSLGSTGTMSSMLDQNNFRNENGVSYMQGDFTFPLSQLGGTDIVISLNDAKIIDLNAAIGTVLTTIDDTTSQTVGGLDLDITYSLKTVQQETLASHTVNSVVYNNVVVSDIIISATATTNIIIDVTVLPTQDIYVIRNYYADGIGLIDSDATFSYELIEIPGQTLPIPTTGSAVTTQEITSYTIN